MPKKLADQIIAWGYKNIPDSCIFFNPNRPFFGRENSPHITVLYGIIGNQENKIKAIVKKFSTFEVTLGATSLFQSESFDVVKINAFGCNLHQINSIFTRNLDVVAIYPKYIPHVTIAYVLKDKKKYQGFTEFTRKKFQVNELTFSFKDGTTQDLKLGECNV